ncbi:hypothetical protein ACKKBG_A24930 [Auxenochlorella protothecoides x Auxenochlorella symbiontica]
MSKSLEFAKHHGEGRGCVAFAPAGGPGAGLLVTTGADGRLAIRDAQAVQIEQASNPIAPGEAAGAHRLAVAPGVVAVLQDSAAKAFTLPDLSSPRLLAGGVLPLRALALSPSGATLAVAGDDPGIRLLAVGSSAVLRTLASAPYTRGLAYDPEGVYLASMGADGNLTVWDIESGRPVFSKKGLASKVDILSRQLCEPAWHPDGGSLLAAPGQDGEVVVYERLSWRQTAVLSLARGSSQRLVAFSPNGLYLAAADEDDYVRVVALQGGQALGARLLPGAAACLTWHPSSNALLLATENGEFTRWNGVVPEDQPGPHEVLDVASAAASLGAEPENILEGGDDDEEEGSLPSDSGPDEPVHGRRRGAGRFRFPPRAPPPQAAFQPGSTRPDRSGRSYLCFNALGTLTLRREPGGGAGVIETSFHDTARHRRRVPLITDHLGFSLGHLGTQGVVLASPATEDAPSTITFRPHEGWAANSDCTKALPDGEEALCVASGDTFFAAATSARLLRIFSLSGLQLCVLCLAGPAVTLTAGGDSLAVVWHAQRPDADGTQHLRYSTYAVAAGAELAQGALPLTPGSTLVWAGFTPEGQLAAQDSAGEVRVAGLRWGAWAPLFSAEAARQGGEHFWLVECGLREVQCVVLAGAEEPGVSVGTAPRPTLSSLPTRPGLLAGGSGAAQEEERFRCLWQRQAARDGAALDAARRAEDQASLRLLAELAKADRCARCLELAQQMHTVAAVEGAVRLATHFKATALADRLSLVLEERMDTGAESQEPQPSPIGGGALLPRSQAQAPATLKRKGAAAGEDAAPNPFSRRPKPAQV